MVHQGIQADLSMQQCWRRRQPLHSLPTFRVYTSSAFPTLVLREYTWRAACARPAETEEANSSLPIPPPPPPAFLATLHFQFRGTSHMIKNAITVAKHRAPNDNSREKQTSNS
jgi:hypothetical protein